MKSKTAIALQGLPDHPDLLVLRQTTSEAITFEQCTAIMTVSEQLAKNEIKSL